MDFIVRHITVAFLVSNIILVFQPLGTRRESTCVSCRGGFNGFCEPQVLKGYKALLKSFIIDFDPTNSLLSGAHRYYRLVATKVWQRKTVNYAAAVLC